MADIATLRIAVDVRDGVVHVRQLGSELDTLAQRGDRAREKLRAFLNQNQQNNASIGQSVHGIGRLNNAFEAMAFSLAGVNPVLGKAAILVGSFGASTVLMTGAVAGIAALAFAWDKITKSAREATKAQDDAYKSAAHAALLKAAGPGGQATLDIGQLSAGIIRLEEERRKYIQNMAASANAGMSGDIGGLREGKLEDIDQKIAAFKTLKRLTEGFKKTAEEEADAQSLGEAARKREAAANKLKAAREKDAAEELQLQKQISDLKLKIILEELGKVAALYAEIEGRIGYSMPSVDINAGLTQAQIKARRKMGIHLEGDDESNPFSQFSPQNIGLGIATSTIGNLIGTAISGFTGMLTNLLGSGKAAAEAFRKIAEEVKASQAAFHAAATGNTLESDLLAQQSRYRQLLEQINAMFPFADSNLPGHAQINALRQRQLDQAGRDEALAEERIRKAHAHDAQYGLEDLVVRNLRALGRGDEAGLLAKREEQQREMQKAIDENRDALYINNLRTTQNNELLAYLNGTLADAVRNAPTGFFGNAYLSEFATPRGYPTDSGYVSPAVPYTGKGSPSDPVTIILQVDGRVLTRTVVNGLDQQAASTSGAGTSRSAALDRYPA